MYIDQVSYDIFEPSNQRIKISRNMIVFGLVGIGLLTAITPIEINDTLRFYYIAFVFLYFLFCSITIFFTYKPLYGKIEGKLEFRSDVVMYGDYRIDLSQVKSINFHFRDYKGQFKYIRRSFNQMKSQGVNNSFEYTDMRGDTCEVFFRLEHPDDHKNLELLIDHYFRISKISHQRRYELQNASFSS